MPDSRRCQRSGAGDGEPTVKPFRNREEWSERSGTKRPTDGRTKRGRGCGAGRTSVGDWSGLTHRIALSCLVDGDHSDTARHYGEPVPGRDWRDAGERLEALDGFVRGLQESGKAQAAGSCGAMYEACRDARAEPSLRTCEAPVGTGKTTAVMRTCCEPRRSADCGTYSWSFRSRTSSGRR